MKRIPAECFSPGEFIRDEIKARGLTERGFEVLLMVKGCTDVQVFACQLAAYNDDPDLILDADTADGLSKALGASPEYWMNLDKAWRDYCARTPAPTDRSNG